MTYCTQQLVDSIHVIKDNSCYNIFNILKGIDLSEDPHWIANRQRLSKNTDTILGIYLNLVKNIIPVDASVYSPGHLRLAIERYIREFNPPRPVESECCVYFRMGDKTVDDNSLSMLDFDYLNLINRQPHKIISIVCCFSFSSIREQWRYSPLRLNQCKAIMIDIIDKIKSKYPESKIQIVSNPNVDHDICYLWNSSFIAHKRSSWRKIFGSL